MFLPALLAGDALAFCWLGLAFLFGAVGLLVVIVASYSC